MSDAGSPRAEVFIATSLDGFIARKNGDIGWLTGLPVPEGEDFGYAAFMDGIGAIVMGRASYDKARSFDSWPYAVPVVVMSRKPEKVVVPEALKGRVRVTAVPPQQLLPVLAAEGVTRVYVDGGQVIRAFLACGLISRMIVTQVPVLLGEGLPLFGHGPGGDIPARLVASRHWPNGFVQNEYALK
jgi:dihydrofolate reductase